MMNDIPEGKITSAICVKQKVIIAMGIFLLQRLHHNNTYNYLWVLNSFSEAENTVWKMFIATNSIQVRQCQHNNLLIKQEILKHISHDKTILLSSFNQLFC